jgi:hypothetical protein
MEDGRIIGGETDGKVDERDGFETGVDRACICIYVWTIAGWREDGTMNIQVRCIS